MRMISGWAVLTALTLTGCGKLRPAAEATQAKALPADRRNARSVT